MFCSHSPTLKAKACYGLRFAPCCSPAQYTTLVGPLHLPVCGSYPDSLSPAQIWYHLQVDSIVAHSLSHILYASFSVVIHCQNCTAFCCFRTARAWIFLFSLACFLSATPGFSTQPPPQLPPSPPPLRRCQWVWQQTSSRRERVGHSLSPAVEARPPLNHRAPRKGQERAWNQRIAPHRMHRWEEVAITHLCTAGP